MNPITPKEEHSALGLKAIYAACRSLYPDQPTPLQVTAVRKFWMGGPDPLDFINMYANPGSIELNSPSHWHYVTNGLSDLYGDSRLHSHSNSTDGPSGFGFELTFRLKKESGETNPPTWPAHLLQSLARYVFYSQAQLMVGDHIPWPTALDKQPHLQEKQTEKRAPEHTANPEEMENTRKSIAMAAAATAASILATHGSKTGESLSALANPSVYSSMVAAALAAVNSTPDAIDSSNSSTVNQSGSVTNQSSRIHHMLLVEDPQLKKICTPYGYIQFLQLVGLCEEELRLVQRWTGSHVADLMSQLPETGGGLLVTDMRRNVNLFESKPSLVDYINEKLHQEGSNLSGVTTAYFAWFPITISNLADPIPGELESRERQQQIQRHNPCARSTFSLSDSISKGFKMSQNKQYPFQNQLDTGKSDSNTSTKPVAMETDDSSTVKKHVDDEEFVDVVGVELTNHKFAADNLMRSPSTNAVCEEPSTLKMSRISSKSKFPSGTKSHFNHLTPPDCFKNNFSLRSSDGQPFSAPGGFSAWCARVGGGNFPLQSPLSRPSLSKATGSSPSTATGSCFSGTPTELTNIFSGAVGFKSFATEFTPNQLVDKQNELVDNKGTHTPGSAGDGSAPCTPLAHLSLSPASLDLMPTRVIDCLDVHLCKEAGEMLPLAINDRLRHGRHFTFLNANCPDHAITLVPSGVSGAFVTEETPYAARGPWLQILLTDDFLEQLEFQFSCLLYPDELILPLVFRWPERHLRICLVDANTNQPGNQITNYKFFANTQNLLPKAASINSPSTNWNIPTSLIEKFRIHESNTIPQQSLRSSATAAAATANQTTPNTDSLTSILSLFPQGCIPPPNILSALVNSSLTHERHSNQNEQTYCDNQSNLTGLNTEQKMTTIYKPEQAQFSTELLTTMTDRNVDTIKQQTQNPFSYILEVMQNQLGSNSLFTQSMMNLLSSNNCNVVASSGTIDLPFSSSTIAPSTRPM